MSDGGKLVSEKSDVTYCQVWWPILRICTLQLTHPKCTHTAVNTHPEQWAAIYAVVPREQLGVRCFAQGHLVVVLKVERVLYIHSPHLQFLPAWDSNSQPLDYKSNSLTIRPRFMSLTRKRVCWGLTPKFVCFSHPCRLTLVQILFSVVWVGPDKTSYWNNWKSVATNGSRGGWLAWPH